MRRRRRAMAEINVVPYIDVMLVLLIIFMAVAPAIQPGQIDLPSVGQSLNPVLAPLEVRISRDGAIQLVDRQQGGKAVTVTRDTLLAAVAAIQATHSDQAVVINADKNLKYDDVLKVMDVLQNGKINRVGLLVKPDK